MSDCEKEVTAYREAKEELERFVRDNPIVFAEYRDLVLRHNAAAEQASKAVRAAGMSSPEFFKMSETQSVNADKLYEEVGAEWFEHLGGRIERVERRAVDLPRFWQCVAAKQVPQEVLDVVVQTERRYRMVKGLSTP